MGLFWVVETEGQTRFLKNWQCELVMLEIKDKKPTGKDPNRELSAQENWC